MTTETYERFYSEFVETQHKAALYESWRAAGMFCAVGMTIFMSVDVLLVFLLMRAS